jgi:hypothetical protein
LVDYQPSAIRTSHWGGGIDDKERESEGQESQIMIMLLGLAIE